jgi:methanogenic corrinoid protein MtbC1
LLERALRGKRAEFVALARSAFDEFGEEILVEDLLVRVLTELGRLWQEGEIHVGEEHLVSRLVEDVLAQLSAWRKPCERAGRRVLVAAPSGDLHELATRLVASAFERNGWEVFLLGANVPCEDLARSAQELAPDVALLSVSINLFVRPAGEAIAALRGVRPELPVLVGGAPFRHHPELAARIGADMACGSAREAEAFARAHLARR